MLSSTPPTGGSGTGRETVTGTKAEIRLLARASLTGLAGTLTDWVLYASILWLGQHVHRLYLFAAFVGAVGGAAANFLLSRYWAFERTDRPILVQAALYLPASVATLIATEGCLWFLIEVMQVNQQLAWLPAKIVAYLAVSYPLARFVVFGGGGEKPG